MIIKDNILINVKDSDIKNGTFEIPNEVVGIADWAFQYSRKLEYIKIPENVLFLGHGIFDNCINLKEVTFSKNLKEFPYTTFNGCDNLEKINVSKENTKYYSRNGVLYNKSVTEIVCCPPTKESVNVPNSINTIKRNAFMGCNKLKNIKLPSGLKTVEACAFSRCSKLTKIEFPENLKNLDYLSLFCSNIKQIVLSDTELKFDYNLLLNFSNLKTVILKSKTNRVVPVPNSEEVFNFINTKSTEKRKKIIDNAHNKNAQSGLALYFYENEKLDIFADKFYNNIYEYGKFIIDNSGDKELENVLSSDMLKKCDYDSDIVLSLKKLKEYYNTQKTIEINKKHE